MEDVYDLVVIGAGPAGQGATELAASFGRRVLIVERNKPGGVVTTRSSRSSETACGCLSLDTPWHYAAANTMGHPYGRLVAPAQLASGGVQRPFRDE
jgi:succinate dehydrogenase/fumarate reductase flavoprotein subunit